MSRVVEARLKAKRARGRGRRASIVDVQNGARARTVRFAEPESATTELKSVLQRLMDPEDLRFEQIRALREQVRVRAADRPTALRTIGVTSSTAGEGKTTLAITLASVMAQEPESRVLLIDADLRKGDVARYLGVETGAGIVDWLDAPEEPIPLKRIEPWGLYVLPAGRAPDQPWKHFASPRWNELMEAAQERFDTVILDCAPLGLVADAARIQDFIDAMILVVRVRSAPREAIRAAVENVRQEKILGVVLNGTRRLSSLYHSNYRHTRYYREAAKEPEPEPEPRDREDTTSLGLRKPFELGDDDSANNNGHQSSDEEGHTEQKNEEDR
jgi:capsular exopolysaccharide synthesis family protein